MTRASYYPCVMASLGVILRGDSEARQHAMRVKPLTASVELNSYRLADSADLTFDSSGFPFHTDDIRSMAVALYAFERQGANELGADFERYMTPENLLVAGRSEEDEIELADGRTFTASVKDYTETFTRRKWPASKVVSPGDTLPRTIQRLVDEASGDQAGAFKVVYEASGQERTVLRGQASSATKIPTVRGEGAKAKGLTWAEGKNWWDVISEICARSGKRVFVRGLDIVISTPHDLAEIAVTGTMLDENGLAFSGSPRVYRMTWGRNIERLTISRRGAGERTPQVIVRSAPLHGGTGKALEGRWPAVSETDVEAHVYVVSPGPSVDDLTAMARTSWHEIARGESEIDFTTSDLSDSDGRSLLRLRPSDAIRIEHDPLRRDELSTMSVDQRYEALTRAGLSNRVAEVVARNLAGLERWNKEYYVRSVGYEWDSESGMTIRIRAANYLNQNAERQLQMPADDGTVLG